MKHPIILMAACATLAACTTKDLYVTGQEWQKQECRKLPDMAERQRCEKSHATSYERYQAERDTLKKPSP